MNYLYLLILVFISGPLTGQKTSAEFGLGIGNVLEAEHKGGKGLLSLGGYLELNENTSIGLEAGTGGNLFPVDNATITVQNTEILSPYSTKLHVVSSKIRRTFEASFGDLYVSIGVGAANYAFNVHARERKTVSSWNMIGTAETGVLLKNNLIVSLKYLSPGKTPRFEGLNTNDVLVTLEEKSVSFIYFNLGFRF
ncbi:MAG: hypothetical protein RIM99_02310 [Cyclobacteriaceae bacterium]